MSATATDFYVSTAKGNDRHDGKAPQFDGTSGPFATLKPLQKMQLGTDDRIFLSCGQRYQGPLHLNLKRGVSGVLVIARYGACAPSERPVLQAREPLAIVGGGDIKAIKSKKPVVQVFSGDMPIARSRFPQDSYLIFPANSASAIDRIPAHPSLIGKDLLGAVVHARTQEWFIEEKTVNSADGNLESSLRYPIRPKAGVYLTGKAWMIGSGSGWAYDNASQFLHVRNKSSGPLSVVYAGNLLQIKGRGAVSVSGIAFDAAGGDAINMKLDGVVNINDVLITRVAGNGISVSGSSYAQITNSHIEDTALDGVFFAEVGRAVVRGNVVVNSGLYLGPGPSLAAINAHRTQGATIEENDVLRSAYIGIRLAGDARIRGNVVESACLFLSDCGAIYSWRRGALDVRPPAEISGNAIINVRGDTTVKFGVNDWFSGIYLDEWSRDVTVRGNLITNAGQGIYLHNAPSNTIEGNYIVGSRHYALLDKYDKQHDLLSSQIKAASFFSDNKELGVGVSGGWSLSRLGVKTSSSSSKIHLVFGLPEDFGAKINSLDLGGCSQQKEANASTPINKLTAFAVYECPVTE